MKKKFLSIAKPQTDDGLLDLFGFSRLFINFFFLSYFAAVHFCGDGPPSRVLVVGQGRFVKQKTSSLLEEEETPPPLIVSTEKKAKFF